MKGLKADWRLIVGYLLAHPLIYFSFEEKKVFWYLFTATMLVLISYSILHEEIENKSGKWNDRMLGILSGIILYAVFWSGNTLIELFDLPFANQIDSLYRQFSPESFWHFLVLLLILAPGEEIFWRGFIQKRILRYLRVWPSIILSTLLYASVQFYSGEWILVLAAVIGGFVWGALYAWKRSIRLVVISHITFDLLLFIIFPLY
jgi:uncharacterized protein